MRLIYYEYMDTACLFIDDSPCVGGISFSFSTCVCVHIKTVIWRVHVTVVERWRGRGGWGGGAAFDLRLVCTLCGGAAVCVRLPSAQMDKHANGI